VDPVGDKSNGYEDMAEHFMRARNPCIGPETVREWSKSLPRGASILELGCGHGMISRVLIEEGFDVYGVDASAKLIAAFRERFPGAHARCVAVEDSDFFGRSFDAIVAWGLKYLLPADLQELVIRKAAQALTPGGRFLFTSGAQPVTWNDSLTGRESVSLGAEAYRRMLQAQGLMLEPELSDEGENYYYSAAKL
jgi:SAM-dependent methyltransferase